MGKVGASQSRVYTLLDKLGPVREIITQKDDEWEKWGLKDLMDNLKRFVEGNPLTTNDHLKDGRTNHYGQFEICNRNMEKGECMKVIRIADRKEMIKKQNCATADVSLDIKPVNVLPEAAGNVVLSTIPLSGTSSIQRSLRKIS